MTRESAGFAVLYRWRLREGLEAGFVEAWTRISGLLLSERASLGSRLHRGADGLWYSYAQWPSAETRRHAFAAQAVDPEAGRAMAAAIAESFPEVVLQPVSDLLVLPASGTAAAPRLETGPHLEQPDAFYEALIEAHRGLGDAQSHALNARLVLLLANHIGRLDTLREALAAARQGAGAVDAANGAAPVNAAAPA